MLMTIVQYLILRLLWPPTHTSNSIFDSLIFQGNEFYLTLDFMCALGLNLLSYSKFIIFFLFLLDIFPKCPVELGGCKLFF